MPTEIQIHELTQATSVNSSDVFAMDTGTKLYKVPASLLISALKNIGSLPTGVKGNAESSYRTGNVNLTPANIGAVALTGGTMTGSLRFSDGTARWQTGADYSVHSETVSKSMIQAIDSSDNPRHQVLAVLSTSGEYRTLLQARQDADHQCTLGPALDASGNALYTVSHPAAFRLAISAPALLASGVKQFGSLAAGSQTYDTISLSPALSNANYIVLTECISSNIVAGVQTKTSSSFVLYVRNVSGGAATGTVSWAVIALP